MLILDKHTVAALPLSSEHPQHAHGTGTLAGYVVRETIRNGTVLWHGTVDDKGHFALCGYDVAVIDGARRYAEALDIMHSYRAGDGYAVIDNIYTCGCRSTR